MKRLEITQVTGGFIVKDLSSNAALGNNTVACCLDTVHAIVRAWADGKEWVPPVAPDAAPAPFRVGDRVVFRNRSKRQDPLTITQIRGDGCRLDIEDAAHIWYDMLEFRHAPVEDL